MPRRGRSPSFRRRRRWHAFSLLCLSSVPRRFRLRRIRFPPLLEFLRRGQRARRQRGPRSDERVPQRQRRCRPRFRPVAPVGRPRERDKGRTSCSSSTERRQHLPVLGSAHLEPAAARGHGQSAAVGAPGKGRDGGGGRRGSGSGSSGSGFRRRRRRRRRSICRGADAGRPEPRPVEPAHGQPPVRRAEGEKIHRRTPRGRTRVAPWARGGEERREGRRVQRGHRTMGDRRWSHRVVLVSSGRHFWERFRVRREEVIVRGDLSRSRGRDGARERERKRARERERARSFLLPLLFFVCLSRRQGEKAKI